MRSCGRKQIALLGALVVSTIALAAHPAETQAMPAGGDRHLAPQPLHEVAPERRAVPILMYHVIRRPYADAPYPDLYVPRAEFAVQIRWLERHGYEAVTLQRVHDAWKGRATLPRRPIVLSFDDGALSHYTNALPILRDHGWPGVLNLDVSNLEPSWGIRPWMVRELVAAGWEIDAHSLTHADLPVLRADGLRRVVGGSRMRIRALFDVPANFF